MDPQTRIKWKKLCKRAAAAAKEGDATTLRALVEKISLLTANKKQRNKPKLAPA
jgi:hypothetical protein